MTVRTACVGLDGLQEKGRVVGRGGGAVGGTVPTVGLEAVAAHARHGGAGAVEAAAQDGAGDAHGPVGVDGAVASGGDGVAVLYDGVAHGGLIAEVEGRHVGVEDVGRVGDVDDERGRGGGVGGVAAEEGRAAVEPEVDEGVGVRDGGEGGAVGDWEEAALVGGDEGGAVGPVGHVSAGVDGEDHVYAPERLDQWLQGDVLEILAAVNQRQSAGAGTDRIAKTEEGVGAVVGNVVVVAAKAGENRL